MHGTGAPLRGLSLVPCFVSAQAVCLPLTSRTCSHVSHPPTHPVNESVIQSVKAVNQSANQVSRSGFVWLIIGCCYGRCFAGKKRAYFVAKAGLPPYSTKPVSKFYGVDLATPARPIQNLPSQPQSRGGPNTDQLWRPLYVRVRGLSFLTHLVGVHILILFETRMSHGRLGY